MANEMTTGGWPPPTTRSIYILISWSLPNPCPPVPGYTAPAAPLYDVLHTFIYGNTALRRSVPEGRS